MENFSIRTENGQRQIKIKIMCAGELPVLEGWFSVDQTVHDVVALALDNLDISSFNRKLKREDGTPIPDWTVKISEVPGDRSWEGQKGVFPNETLRFFLSAPKPQRDKGWAMLSEEQYNSPQNMNRDNAIVGYRSV